MATRAQRRAQRTVDRATVRGMRHLRAQMARIDPVFRERFDLATESTAIAIASAAQRRVRVRRGALRRHILHTFSRRTGLGRVGVAKGTETYQGRTINPVKYANAIERGTAHHRAFPFMLVAAEEEREHYVTRVKAAGRAAESSMGGRFL